MATQPPELDLVDQMRRLSVGSDRSAFSIVSEAPTVRSLDTDGSVDGGISVVSSPADAPKAAIKTLVIRERAPAPVITSSENETNATHDVSSTDPFASKASPFWYQFPGFDPDPKAAFRGEFKRLALNQSWDTVTKRERKPEALTAEIAFHYGTCMTKLGCWQELCEDVGLDEIPTSINQCKKVGTQVLGMQLWLMITGS